MKKIIMVLFTLIFMCGCTQKETIPSFTFTMYYAEGCGYCEYAKEKFIPVLEDEFKEAITIEYVSLDTLEGENEYYQLVGYIDENGNEVEGLLEDTDYEVKECLNYPFFVVDEYYGFFGYDDFYNNEYIEDIYHALNDEPLTNLLSPGRFMFKDK